MMTEGEGDGTKPEWKKKRGGEAKSITAFSPYAARLGWSNTPDADMNGVVTRLEGLRLEPAGGEVRGDCKHHEESLRSPSKTHYSSGKENAAGGAGGAARARVPSPAPETDAGIVRRMDFFQAGDDAPQASAPPAAGPAMPLPPPPPPLRPANPSPKATATAAVSAPAPPGVGPFGAPVDRCAHADGGKDDFGGGRLVPEPVPVPEPEPTAAKGSCAIGGLQQGEDAPASPLAEAIVGAKEKQTLVVYPPECLLHMGVEEHENHQEKPRRLELLCGEGGALRRKAFQGLEWVDPSLITPALITDLLRVHEYDYLVHIQERCAGAPPSSVRPTPAPCQGASGSAGLSNTSNGAGGNNHGSSDDGKITPPNDSAGATREVSGVFAPAPVATTSTSGGFPSGSQAVPVVVGGRGGFGNRFEADAGFVDVDTRVSRESLGAARMAAGAVILAVDRVVQGENPNAFVAVRPPGHHAGPSGSVPSSSFWKNPGMNSSGFCLLNSAAIGAAYARSRYGRSGDLSRVAIVDIDIHHGNGTEEIVRCLRPMTTRLPLPPSWPPVTKTVYKPWLDERDAENTFFGSVSLQDRDGLFYPASGTEEEHFDDNSNIVNVSLSPLGPTPGDEAKKRALTKTRLTELTTKAGNEFKRKCQQTLLAKLKAFSPDLLIISAGFDGHVEDYYHYLSDDMYEWITLALVDCCPSGRVVSVLEGGYSLEARVSRAKAAQQARANIKRAEAAAAKTSATSAGPALRERRSRPSTRAKNASVASSSSSSAAAAATVVPSRTGSSPPHPPLETPLLPPSTADAPSSSAAAAAAAAAAASAEATSISSSTAMPSGDHYLTSSSSPSPGGCAAGAAGEATGSTAAAGGTSCSSAEQLSGNASSEIVPRTAAVPGTAAPSVVVSVGPSGPVAARVGGDEGGCSVDAGGGGGGSGGVPSTVGAGRLPLHAADRSKSNTNNISNGPVAEGKIKSSRKFPAVVEKEEEDSSLLVRTGDGGLVRGVVSHVSALMLASAAAASATATATATTTASGQQQQQQHEK